MGSNRLLRYRAPGCQCLDRILRKTGGGHPEVREIAEVVEPGQALRRQKWRPDHCGGTEFVGHVGEQGVEFEQECGSLWFEDDQAGAGVQ